MGPKKRTRGKRAIPLTPATRDDNASSFSYQGDNTEFQTSGPVLETLFQAVRAKDLEAFKGLAAVCRSWWGLKRTMCTKVVLTGVTGDNVLGLTAALDQHPNLDEVVEAGMDRVLADAVSLALARRAWRAVSVAWLNAPLVVKQSGASLRKLHFTGGTLEPSEVIACLSHCKNLESLAVDTIADLEAPLWKKVVATIPQPAASLLSLHLGVAVDAGDYSKSGPHKSTNCTPEEFYCNVFCCITCHNPEKTPNLEHLSVYLKDCDLSHRVQSCNHYLEKNDVSQLVRGLPRLRTFKCTFLGELEAKGNWMDDELLEVIGSSCSELQTFILSGVAEKVHVTNVTRPGITRLLLQCPDLKVLDISACTKEVQDNYDIWKGSHPVD